MQTHHVSFESHHSAATMYVAGMLGESAALEAEEIVRALSSQRVRRTPRSAGRRLHRSRFVRAHRARHASLARSTQRSGDVGVSGALTTAPRRAHRSAASSDHDQPFASPFTSPRNRSLARPQLGRSSHPRIGIAARHRDELADEYVARIVHAEAHARHADEHGERNQRRSRAAETRPRTRTPPTSPRPNVPTETRTGRARRPVRTRASSASMGAAGRRFASPAARSGARRPASPAHDAPPRRAARPSPSGNARRRDAERHAAEMREHRPEQPRSSRDAASKIDQREQLAVARVESGEQKARPAWSGDHGGGCCVVPGEHFRAARALERCRHIDAERAENGRRYVEQRHRTELRAAPPRPRERQDRNRAVERMIALVIVRLRPAAAMIGEHDEHRLWIVHTASSIRKTSHRGGGSASAYCGDIQPCAWPARSASGQCSRIKPRRCVRSVGRAAARMLSGAVPARCSPLRPRRRPMRAAMPRNTAGTSAMNRGRRKSAARQIRGSGNEAGARPWNEQVVAREAVRRGQTPVISDVMAAVSRSARRSSPRSDDAPFAISVRMCSSSNRSIASGRSPSRTTTTTRRTRIVSHAFSVGVQQCPRGETFGVARHLSRDGGVPDA